VAAPASPPASSVIVPLLPGVEIGDLLPLAVDLAGPAGRIVLAAIVAVRHGADLPAAAAAARSARRELRATARLIPRGTAHEVAVRAADSPLAGLKQLGAELGGIMLVGLPREAPLEALRKQPWRGLLAEPATQTVLARLPHGRRLSSVLVSARGGPHAELAIALAQTVARAQGAAITVMHVDTAGSNSLRRQREQQLFQELVAHSADAGRMRTTSLAAGDVAQTVLAEASRHDLLVLGSQVGRDPGGEGPGAVPEAALRRDDLAVLIARAPGRIDPGIFRRRPGRIDEIVNTWFVEHTMHCRDYDNLEELLSAKHRQGLTLAGVLLEGAGYDTLAGHARVLVDELQRGAPLLDEALFVCASEEAADAAAEAGLPTRRVPDAGPGERGRLIYAALRAVSADLVVLLDADLRNPHQKVVYGLAGPLLLQPHVRLVEGFFGLPREAPDADLRVLVGELTARPLVDLYFPELAGFIEPLGVEIALRRQDALALPCFSGPAAPLGLLVDTVERHGLGAVAQVGLDAGIARPLSLAEAARLAFSATQILARRAGLEAATDGASGAATLKLLHESDGRFQITLADATEHEQRD